MVTSCCHMNELISKSNEIWYHSYQALLHGKSKGISLARLYSQVHVCVCVVHIHNDASGILASTDITLTDNKTSPTMTTQTKTQYTHLADLMGHVQTRRYRCKTLLWKLYHCTSMAWMWVHNTSEVITTRNRHIHPNTRDYTNIGIYSVKVTTATLHYSSA